MRLGGVVTIWDLSVLKYTAYSEEKIQTNEIKPSSKAKNSNEILFKQIYLLTIKSTIQWVL